MKKTVYLKKAGVYAAFLLPVFVCGIAGGDKMCIRDSINGVYADFILQFDWINYAWDDRPTKEDGKVNFVDKPADGLGTELYSPLGISLGKSTPTAGWAEAKLLRFFDTYNLVQFINNNEGAGTVKMCIRDRV